ncbi:MAG TPA: hypothetical protein VFN10_04415 [Thermoanaerobaculia bacterium]|nr:hypothetical protein [Thermoanaerobaculia bacterium]
MRTTKRLAMSVIAALLLAAGSAMAAVPSEFYTNMLRRGVTDYNAGRFEAAASELRIAAFGLLDAIDQYQTAQIYSALASEKLTQEGEARRAAERVVAAEGVQARYASLSIPSDIRAAFETLAARLLTASQAAKLPRAPASSAAVQPDVSATPTPVKTPPKTQTPKVETPKAETPKPAPQKTEPPKAQPAPKKVEQRSIPAEQIVVDPPKAKTTTTTTTTVPPVPPPPPAAKTVDVQARFATAEAALLRNDLASARTALREVADVPSLDRAALFRLAEGAYRARDFNTALRAFRRIGTFHPGEEPYHYYFAVALYETGAYGEAKREINAALPFIEVTPDVARYQEKIDRALN